MWFINTIYSTTTTVLGLLGFPALFSKIVRQKSLFRVLWKNKNLKQTFKLFHEIIGL